VALTGTAASGQVPVATGAGAGAWGYPPGFVWSYTQITANANVTDTSEATATGLITTGSVTYDGNPVLVEFFCASVLTDTAAAGDTVTVTLFEGSTQITRLGVHKTIVTATPNNDSLYCAYRFTPTAAAHTYKLCAFTTSTTGTPTLTAGAGGTNTYSPAFLRITKV